LADHQWAVVLPIGNALLFDRRKMRRESNDPNIARATIGLKLAGIRLEQIG